MIYIKNNRFFEFPIELGSNYMQGTTWEDSLNDLWVPLSVSQLEFKKNHPQASPKEVFDMALHIHVKTIEEYRAEKLAALYNYDISESVSSFSIDGTSTWIDKGERSNILQGLQSEQRAGVAVSYIRFINIGLKLILPVATCIGIIDAIEIYSKLCFDCTKSHEDSIKALNSIEEIELYDFTVGYPVKLTLSSINQ